MRSFKNTNSSLMCNSRVIDDDVTMIDMPRLQRVRHGAAQSLGVALPMRGSRTSFHAGPSSVAFSGELFAISRSDLHHRIGLSLLSGALTE